MLMRSPLARERRRPPGFIKPCQPTLSEKAPSGPQWIHEIKHDVVTQRPLEREERQEKPKPPAVSTGLPDAAIAALLIKASIANYSGSCACPYQSDRAGRSCGRRSAHSKPGGNAPLCFEDDVTPAMIASYRRQNGSREAASR